MLSRSSEVLTQKRDRKFAHRRGAQCPEMRLNFLPMGQNSTMAAIGTEINRVEDVDQAIHLFSAPNRCSELGALPSPWILPTALMQPGRALGMAAKSPE